MKIIPFEYPHDLINLDRWMCPKCGLIFDFLLGVDEIGGINYDPPLQNVDYWRDEEGNIHIEEVEHREICPRCSCDLTEFPTIRIFVSQTARLEDVKPLIEKGEGLYFEFMRSYPDNAHEIGKELAAFATSNGGKIFLGVENNGDIIGLQDIDTPEGKDSLLQRIRGVSSKIDPKIDCDVTFISGNELHIAIITIRKGFMAFYVYEGKIYIRDLDASRPATSDEITRLTIEWHESLGRSPRPPTHR